MTWTQRQQGYRFRLRPPPQTPMAYNWYWPTKAPEMVGAVAAAASMADRRQPCPPHLSRISLHFGCISQTIAFSEASRDRPADVVICESRCMDSLQSNVILLTGCGGGMYNLIYLFPTSFKP